MTKAKKQTKRRRGQSASKAMLDASVNALYRAVNDFVRAAGGSVAVVGDVYIHQIPDDRDHNFSVCVRVTGWKPQNLKASNAKLTGSAP